MFGGVNKNLHGWSQQPAVAVGVAELADASVPCVTSQQAGFQDCVFSVEHAEKLHDTGALIYQSNQAERNIKQRTCQGLALTLSNNGINNKGKTLKSHVWELQSAQVAGKEASRCPKPRHLNTSVSWDAYMNTRYSGCERCITAVTRPHAACRRACRAAVRIK